MLRRIVTLPLPTGWDFNLGCPNSLPRELTRTALKILAFTGTIVGAIVGALARELFAYLFHHSPWPPKSQASHQNNFVHHVRLIRQTIPV